MHAASRSGLTRVLVSYVTSVRAEEEFGFNAEPCVRTGKFVKILGL